MVKVSECTPSKLSKLLLDNPRIANQVRTLDLDIVDKLVEARDGLDIAQTRNVDGRCFQMPSFAFTGWHYNRQGISLIRLCGLDHWPQAIR
jgi:hypothetical protein